MKRLSLALALACMALFVQAQDIPAGLRMEIVEIEDNDESYSLFSYKDEDGTFGYYLGLGHEYRLLEIFVDGDSHSSFSHLDETCLWMGETVADAYASLERLLALLEEEPGTTAEFPCRMTGGAERLTASVTATCIVVKRFLQAKRLQFHFPVGNRTGEAELSKSALKSLRWSLNVNQKLHPSD